ncbi:restriction endonuclease subunit R [Pseudarthrobacter enclensis]|uniref:restriction endonuclease subunit R n=1 Tax=Pseudarthrobacter enclensis TaxID=993070 RepID=UPI00341E0EF8
MAASLPQGWTLCASAFNWAPDIIAAHRPAPEIVTAIVEEGIADTVELEPGLLWRSFPEPDGGEVDRFRSGLAAAGGRVSMAGVSLDDFSSPTRVRPPQERLDFLVPQLRAAARVGAAGVRLPIGQAGPDLLRHLLPLLHELDLVLYEEIQGQQAPSAPATAEALETVASIGDPRLRILVDISMLMPALPVSYLDELSRGGVPADLVARLAAEWQGPETQDAVVSFLRSGNVPPQVHTLYMNLLIRFGRSHARDLQDVLPLVGAFHLKFWDLEDDGGRISRPIHDLGRLLGSEGFTGTLTSEWGGHEWLRDDPTAMTRQHLALAARSLAS